MFEFNAYRSVHKAPFEKTGKSVIDKHKLHELDKELVTMEAVDAHNKKVTKEFNEKLKQEEMMESLVNHKIAKNRSYYVLDKLYPTYADNLLGEAYSTIFIRSLPHDSNFVAEYFKALNTMGHMYIRKLGGMPYLKHVIESNHNPYLTKLYKVVDEQAKKHVEEVSKKLKNSINNEEIYEMIHGKINDEEQKKLIKNINQLGTDKLTELIKYKVVSVVKDEQQREKDEREQRTILKNELVDPDRTADLTDNNDRLNTGDQVEDVDTVSDKKIPEGNDDIPKAEKSKKKSKSIPMTKKDEDDLGADNLEKDVDTDFDKKKNEDNKAKNKKIKNTNKKNDNGIPKGTMVTKLDKKKDDKGKVHRGMEEWSTWQVMEKHDPITGKFNYDQNKQGKTLFFSIINSIAKESIFGAQESVTKITDIPSYVLENPLNLELFNIYAKDNQGGLEDVEMSTIHDPKVIGSSEDYVMDKDSIMTEAVLQYTLLETAYTMKLINPTATEVREQCERLLA